MAKFMLLLYNEPRAWSSLSPAEVQKALEKFIAWRTKLQDQGIYLGSHKLADDPGKVLRGHGQVRVTDGPYSETKEVLGGYFLIEAPSYDEAVKYSRDCPSLEYKGTIEVRQVDPMSPGKG
jgi:hypothetical protein